MLMARIHGSLRSVTRKTTKTISQTLKTPSPRTAKRSAKRARSLNVPTPEIIASAVRIARFLKSALREARPQARGLPQGNRFRQAPPSERRCAPPPQLPLRRFGSPPQLDDGGQMFGRVGALADMDFKAPGLQDGVESWSNEREGLDGQPPRHLPALSGRHNDLAHPFQLQERTSDACDDVSHEQEQRRLAVNLAVVADRGRHLDAFACLHPARIASQIEDPKAAVGQAVTKGKLRRRRRIKILACIMLVLIRRSTRRALAVKDRDLSDIARPAHRQSSRRIESSGQNIGDGVPRFAPEKPRSDDGVRPLEDPGQGERAAGKKQYDDRFAEAEYGLGEFALAPRKAE